ncbi:MAG: PEP-utilizing enzyme [Patescibacteria group bacterium]
MSEKRTNRRKKAEYKNWHRLVARNAAVLPAQNIMMGYITGSFKDAVNVDCGFSEFRYINYGAYVTKKDFFNFIEKVQEKVKKDSSFIKWVIKRNYEQCDKLLGTAKVEKINWSKKSNCELKLLLQKYISEFHKMGPFWAVPFAVEKIGTSIISEELKKKLGKKNKSKFRDYFLVLTSPSKEGYVGKEQREFLELAIEIQKQGYSLNSVKLKTTLKKENTLWNKIVDHVSRYAWLNIQYMIGNQWTVEDFFIRLKHISNPKEELNEQKNARIKTEQELKRIIKKLNFSRRTKEIIDAIREYVFLRTYRKDVTTLADYKVRPLLVEIGKRFEFSFDEMIYQSVEEINQLLIDGKKLKKKIIRERMEDFAILADKQRVDVIGSNVLEDYKKTWGEKEVNKDVKEFQGEVASKGYGKGKTRVVVDRRLIPTFQKGEILVTTMTTPDFVPAMQKAAAIVTDEGGILCHAAIISRELNKPCVIGTEIATKILKTGFLVEVDAEQGIVRILQK